MADFALYFASIFSIVNPFAAIPVYLGVTADTPPSQRRGIPRKTALASTIILLVAYAIGESLLSFFSISIASLRVAGGILIFAMAWSMLQARTSRQKQTPEEAEEATHRDSLAVVPLAMPLLAGPGAISVMILWATRSGGVAGHLPAVAAVVSVALSIWVILSLATPISKLLGQTGMNVATRFMGLILAAVAVEFVAGGLQDLFPAWAVGR
ncbi:MAG TPA: MarC family protein [Longimicrobiales bacterium]|nr:MarC family protein [Longimicrobiales bacterium]